MKKITFKIAGKIGLGYGILTIAIIVNAALVNRVIVKSSDLNKKISETYEPSSFKLNQLSNLIEKSHQLIHSWVFVDRIADTHDKLLLIDLQEKQFPALENDINKLADNWNDTLKIQYFQIRTLIRDSLFKMQQNIMASLKSISDYDAPEINFMIIPQVTDNGDITKTKESIVNKLAKLIDYQRATITLLRADMTNSFTRLLKYIVFTNIALILVAIIIAFFTTKILVNPINMIKSRLLSMSKGILPADNMAEHKDEIGEMAKALNQLVSGLKATSDFALEIGRGNYQSNFVPLSDEDVLGNSLIQMRNDLQAARIEDSKRKLEDEQRNWATAGIAKFSEILRQDNDKIDLLSFHIISNLVNYMNANQGGIFMINETDSSKVYIELVSCYAYNRQKFLQKRIELGEGLVGRCLLEKETIYLTDIPNEYIKIKSGLGEANPRSLLLVPLIMNNDVFGVIEIASFEMIEHYQIEFVEKIAQSIASTLKAVRINMSTSRLLEQSRIQAEELAAQEEEMRQNMEELRATQEQSFRKEKELQKTVDDLQKKLGENK